MDDQSTGHSATAPGLVRDKVIQAIYETVLRPRHYDHFMDLWREHIQAAVHQTGPDARIDDACRELDEDADLRAHFDRAYEILEQIGRSKPAGSLRDEVIASDRFMLMVDPAGNVRAASQKAREVIGEAGVADSFLESLSGGSEPQIRSLMRLAARQGPGDGAAVVLLRAEPPRHMSARLVPCGKGNDRSGVLIEALELAWSPLAERTLVQSFGLSPAEIGIVRNLAGGHSLREIAKRSSRSEHTVRNQAKAVLAKTGAPGQADLIRLVASLIGRQESADPDGLSGGVGVENAPHHYPPHEQMRMPSGLNMQVFEAGDPQGQPVILINGMLDGSAPVRFLHERLSARGLRLIAPLRPGFGRSDPTTDSDRMAAVFFDHVEALLDRIGPQKPVLLGHLTGSVFAYILAARLKTRIAGLVAVSGGMPITRFAQLRRMAPRQRVVFYTTRYTPRLLPTILRAGIAQLDGDDPDAFLTSMYRPGTVELDLIRQMHLEPLLQSGFRESVAQGARGFADESLFLVQDWSDRICAESAPAVFISGSQDPVVDSADLKAGLACNPAARVQIVQGEGQLLLYARPDMILDLVEGFSGSSPKT